MQRAVKSSIVVLSGFFLYTFILGIISFYLFSDVAPDIFGNPLQSMYAVFRIFTIEGWFEIPDAIAVNYEAFGQILTYLYFMFVLFSGGIIGLSLINSIFVEEMMSDNTNEIEEHLVRVEEKLDKLLEKEKI
jgi:voltage-gated sodium channel